ncbi:MAG: PHB depolymerase family esterase [Bacteroidota bacterium]
MKVLKSIAVLFLATLLTTNLSGQSLTPVPSFGSNPGNLSMFTYVPVGISGAVPVVIAMHGCSQSASIYAVESGWNKLADRHKFIMIYPEQVSANNSSKCFNWFEAGDQSKNQGEALSIKQMVDYIQSNYTIDPAKIFVTGLSAGAGMTSVMLAAYPEVFHKGAIMAGIPYKASSSASTATFAMGGYVVKTPTQWGTLVRNENPSYTGPFPDVAIFHGSADLTVNIINAAELIDQWTDVNNADQTADATNSAFQGNTSVEQKIYKDNLNNPVVYYYKITGMGHGISVNTGPCPKQGGTTGTYTLEKNFHSTYWAADFFDLITDPYPISGAIQVTQNATNVTYSVVNTSGSTYAWTIPSGASIVSGQGSNSIVVNFGTSSGSISVEETTSTSCKNDIATLYITVGYLVTVSQTSFIACNGASTAALSVVATGGTGSYTYNWSSGGGTASVASGLAAGVYTVTVTDNAAVVVTSSGFTVNEPAVISENQTITLCAGETITIGSNTYSVSNTYLDTLNAANGCDSVLTTNLTVYATSSATLNLSGDDTLCSTEGAFVLSGGSPVNGVYSGSSVTAGSFNPGTAAIGWNNILYTVMDGNNCSKTLYDSIYVNSCITTGLSADLDISKNILVYPNPANDAITVSAKGQDQFELSLYNSIGALIFNKQFDTNVATMDIHTLQPGLYLMMMKTKEGLITQKIIKN